VRAGRRGAGLGSAGLSRARARLGLAGGQALQALGLPGIGRRQPGELPRGLVGIGVQAGHVPGIVTRGRGRGHGPARPWDPRARYGLGRPGLFRPVPASASLRAMRFAGVTASQFFKIGIIAVLFIVLFKAVAVRSNIPGLQAVAGAV
jgi:hypothetical protein